MSLFDVLKYPISKPVTVKEIEALPDAIYDSWYKDHIMEYDTLGMYKDRRGIASLLDGVTDEDDLLNDFRRRIREYDSDD